MCSTACVLGRTEIKKTILKDSDRDPHKSLP